jgi:hypothetical protein
MNSLDIRIRDNRTTFSPGETIEGALHWTLDSAVEALELRLVWHTQGKGDTDVSVEDTRRFEAPSPAGSESFRFALPEAPYSFSGKLISLSWMLELVVLPGEDAAQIEFVLAPSGKEVLLAQGEDNKPSVNRPFSNWLKRKSTPHSSGSALEQRNPFDN